MFCTKGIPGNSTFGTQKCVAKSGERTNLLCNIWHSMRQLLLLSLLLPRQLLLILLLPWLADNFACHLINCHANYGVNIITFYSAVNLCVLRRAKGTRNLSTLWAPRRHAKSQFARAAAWMKRSEWHSLQPRHDLERPDCVCECVCV